MEAMASVPPRPTTLHPPGADTLIDGAGPRSALCTHLDDFAPHNVNSSGQRRQWAQPGRGCLLSRRIINHPSGDWGG